jgi:hypothetical protein
MKMHVLQALKVIGANILVFFGFLLLIEITGQLIALSRPSYEVLFLQPDRVVGWKQVPNLRWTWAGSHWYAADFSVGIETNPLGFRDIGRELSKPPEVTRVALLGDSFIEAVQVPFTKTASQVLEQQLNASLYTGQDYLQRWEVLNFGISNYGIGQYLLTWEKYAKMYHPDYIAIFVAKFHMQRTINKYELGAFSDTSQKKLWVRPTFRIENGVLIRDSAYDYDRFIKTQEDLISTKFTGDRSRKKMKLITWYYGKKLFEGVIERFNRNSNQIANLSQSDSSEDNLLFAVNLKIIEELGQQVHGAGGKLIVIDVSQYFGDDAIVSRTLKEFCSKHSFGYIPLYKDLLQTNLNGLSTRWPHDGHFNEAGNIILARSLYNWIEKNAH